LVIQLHLILELVVKLIFTAVTIRAHHSMFRGKTVLLRGRVGVSIIG